MDEEHLLDAAVELVVVAPPLAVALNRAGPAVAVAEDAVEEQQGAYWELHALLQIELRSSADSYHLAFPFAYRHYCIAVASLPAVGVLVLLLVAASYAAVPFASED